MRWLIFALLLLFPTLGNGQTTKYILDGNDNVKIEFFNSTNVLVISNAILTNSSSFRDALSLGATWLTNNNVTNFRTAIGLGVTNSVEFKTIKATNVESPSLFEDIEMDQLDANEGAFGTTNQVIINALGISFSTNTIAAITRTNLGLPLAALTNNNVTNFRTAIGLGTAATNDASAFQPASSALTNLAANNAANLTNFPALLLRTNGSAAGLTGFPTLNQNTTGTASNVTGVVAILNGGTGATNTQQFQAALFNSTSLNAQGQKITNLASPVNDADAATKAYVFGLFSRVAPTVSFANTTGTVEIGSTVPSVSLSWTISPTNTTVSSQTLTGSQGTVSAIIATNRSATASTNFTSDTTWTLIVNDGTGLPGGIVTNTTSIAFRHYMSWGISSSTNLNNSQIRNLHTNTAAGAGREFRTGKGKSVNISGNGQYIYFAYPASFGAASFIVNSAPNTAWISNTVTYTNTSGNVTNFLIYRSTDVLFGTNIPITIN